MNPKDAKDLHQGGPPPTTPGGIVHQGPTYGTAIQAALVMLSAQLEAFGHEFSPCEYAVLLDIHGRRVQKAAAHPAHQRWLKDAA